MCFCETNRIHFAQKIAFIKLSQKGLHGKDFDFSIRFVWNENDMWRLVRHGSRTQIRERLLAMQGAIFYACETVALSTTEARLVRLGSASLRVTGGGKRR
jgi:hypothetical protein